MHELRRRPRSAAGRAARGVTLALGVALGTLGLAACSTSGALTSTVSGGTPSAAASPVAVATPDSPFVDRRVFVEGDSLTVGIADFLPAMLDPVGRPVTVDAQVGRTTAEGIDSLQMRTSEIGGTLVVALGTNDLPDPVAFAASIDQIMIIAAGRPVIWVTVARAGWDQLDEALITAQARWSNLEVIDWRPIIAAHPLMLGADGIHLTEAGYQLRALFIAGAVESQR